MTHPSAKSAPLKSTIEPRTLRLLELDKVLNRLEGAASCELGRIRVRALQPIAQTEAVAQTQAVRRALAETSEAVRFLELGKSPIFGGITDVSALLQRAAIGSMLEARELMAIARLAEGARRLRQSIQSVPTDEFPLLHDYADDIVPHPALEKSIGDAIDEATGEVKDDASLALLKARRNIRQTQGHIQERLRRMLADPNVQPLLQDAFVTVRDGRYCLPVKAESRSRVPGIVHDRSGSGGAFFVEPQAVVEMNNRLRELHIEEREAIVEILQVLSAQAGGARDELQVAMQACGLLDFAFAKARLSLAMKAREIEIEENPPGGEVSSRYSLIQACHPLIQECVPNDIRLGDDFDALMITGPNTGGKTVVLKTLGLLTLMAMCGLHIPVQENSVLRLPGAIYADIGDEQSIEQSLSTFSSHMRNIIHILSNAQPGDLILFDEIGAGTDPDEGAALAKAVLRNLQRRGAQVVATTHYGELKQFALGSERFENASVEFDAKSLRPTYHLRIGVPGASNALDIAARLGMRRELVQRARRYLGRDRAEAEAATQRLEETQRELQEQTAEASRERSEVERLRRDYERKLARLQVQFDAEREKSMQEASRLVREAQQEADAILRDLRSAVKEAPRESKQTENARQRLRTLRERVNTTAKSRELDERNGSREEAAAPTMPRPTNRADLSALRSGDIVRLKSLNREAVLLEEPGTKSKVSVRVGAMKLQVAATDIDAPTDNTGTATPTGGTGNSGVASIQIRKAVTVPDEINLIGKTTEEALPELEKYLDDALLAGTEQVRVIHGRGSGALRAAIHRRLKSLRFVTEFELASPQEGGEGATIVSLR